MAGSVGAGLEYFFNDHVSIGLAVPVMIFPDWDTRCSGATWTDRPTAR